MAALKVFDKLEAIKMILFVLKVQLSTHLLRLIECRHHV